MNYHSIVSMEIPIGLNRIKHNGIKVEEIGVSTYLSTLKPLNEVVIPGLT